MFLEQQINIKLAAKINK